MVAPALVLGDRSLCGFVLERWMGFDHGPPLRFCLPGRMRKIPPHDFNLLGLMQRGLGKAPGADSHLRGHARCHCRHDLDISSCELDVCRVKPPVGLADEAILVEVGSIPPLSGHPPHRGPALGLPM